jgi:hypothetical protein
MQNKKEDSKMVETKQGSGRTGRKRGLWGGFRDPAFREMVRNGEISPSSEMTPETDIRTNRNHALVNQESPIHRRRWLAQMETHVMYFGEEWFDFESMIKDKLSDTRSGSATTPYRCPLCQRPWSSGETSSQEYYEKSFFNNIPMENNVCQECDSVLPAGAN